MKNPMEARNLSPNPHENISNLEQERQKLAAEVKLELAKIKDEVIQFNLLTCSQKAGGFWDTNEGIKSVQFDSRYRDEFELYRLTGGYEDAISTGYIYDKKINKVTFHGYLGRSLHTTARDGNGLFITLKFNKDFDSKNAIGLIAKLIDTVIAYKGNDRRADRTAEQDIKDIAIESITVLEAFENISEKFPSTGHISVTSMIEECKEILSGSK